MEKDNNELASYELVEIAGLCYFLASIYGFDMNKKWMRSMPKNWKSFSLFILIILLLAGCSKQQKTGIKVNDIEKPPSLPEENNKEMETTDTAADIPPQLPNTSTGINLNISPPSLPDAPPKNETPRQAQPEPSLINGKTVEERIQEAQDRLHTIGSGQHIRDNFLDLELVYTDSASGTGFPQMILPFRYYYSAEANKTFNICNIDLTVFICDGKLDRLITKEELDSGRCEATQIYSGGDPRLGGSGGQIYGYGYNN